MKVLWLSSWYPNPLRPYDGDFIQRHAKAVSLITPITVLYVDQSGHKQAIDQNLDMERRDQSLTEQIIFFKYKPIGIDLIDKIRYNLLYFKTYKRYLRKYIIKNGKPDLVHVHIPMKAGMLARWLLQAYKIHYIVSEHSVHYQMGSPDDFFHKSTRHRKQVSAVFTDASAVTNVSGAMAQKLKSIFQLRAVDVVNNTVNTNLFHIRVQTPHLFRFIHVSTLDEQQKNVQGMLEAVQKLSEVRSDFEFLIVGPASNKLIQEVTDRKLIDRVKFSGEIPYEQVASEMGGADALVLFSRFENSPCVIIEALSSGLPVISSKTGGIPEVIDSSNGILVESESVDQLTQAMLAMLNQYEKYNRPAIAKLANERYSYGIIGKQFYELYQNVLQTVKKI